MSSFIAELIGTMLLILLGNGVVANVVLDKTYGNNGGWLLINFGWGLAVYVAVVVAGPYSGAHLNPAVTIALATAGLFEWNQVGSYIAAQMAGAAIGSGLVWLNYKDHYFQTENTDVKLATFCTKPAIGNNFSNIMTEAIGAFVLVFVVLYIAGPSFSADNIENAQIGLGSLGALPVALLVTAIGMSLGGATGYAINPARDLAPRIMHAILPMGKKGSGNWAYSWIPVGGPILGGVLAAALFLILK